MRSDDDIRADLRRADADFSHGEEPHVPTMWRLSVDASDLLSRAVAAEQERDHWVEWNAVQARALAAVRELRDALAKDSDLVVRNFSSLLDAALDPDGPVVRNENACHECGVDNPVWFAPNEIWNRVMGGPGERDDPGGFLCPGCFIRRAEASGLRPTGWELRPEPTKRQAFVEEMAGLPAGRRAEDALAAVRELLNEHADSTVYGEACITHDSLRAALATAEQPEPPVQGTQNSRQNSAPTESWDQ